MATRADPTGPFRRDQRGHKRRLVRMLAEVPPDLSAGELRHRIGRLVTRARDLRIGSTIELDALQSTLLLALDRGDFYAARRAIERLPDSVVDQAAIAAPLVLAAAALVLGGWAGWFAGVLLVAWAVDVLFHLAGTRWFVSEVPVVVESIDSARWVKARLAVGDLAGALAEHRALRARCDDPAGSTEAPVLRVVLANHVTELAISGLDIPLAELAADALALAELPDSREHWHTAHALTAIADLIAAADPALADTLRRARDDVRARITTAHERPRRPA